jgi:hypothetical protein
VDAFEEVSAVSDSIAAYAADLRARLVTAGLLDNTTGLPRSVSTSADSAGAVWNYMMYAEDRSKGIHNPLYVKDLLASSINYISGPAPLAAHWRLPKD